MTDPKTEGKLVIRIPRTWQKKLRFLSLDLDKSVQKIVLGWIKEAMQEAGIKLNGSNGLLYKQTPPKREAVDESLMKLPKNDGPTSDSQ